MHLVTQLNFGSIDAINYKNRKDREFLSRVFFRDEFLDDILESRKYFLIGEKGTGKTAYAVWLNNNDYRNTRSSIFNINATDYQSFVKLKELGYLNITNYKDIWKSILLLRSATHLRERENKNALSFSKFKALDEAIKRYHDYALDPERINIVEFLENAEQTATIISEAGGFKDRESFSEKFSLNKIQLNLIYIIRKFMDGIAELKLEKDHVIFVDGIDIRPADIEFPEYISCIKGLAHAAWELNSEIFGNIRDSRGRVKVVLLLRPDIFGKLDFQNANAKVQDNSVVLDWRTTYGEYRKSRIFTMIDGVFSKQQDSYKGSNVGSAWDYYFPYDLPNLFRAEQVDNAFIGFLRYSLYRPRDIISYLLIMQDYVKRHEDDKKTFSYDSFKNTESEYSNYLLGEIRDHLSFYYSDIDFDDLVAFFNFVDGKNRITYGEFRRSYLKYEEHIRKKGVQMQELVSGHDEFLQFLFSLNVVGYAENTDTGSTFIHWSFRDRTPFVLNPPVRFGEVYHVHPGLARALSVGGAGRRAR